MIKNLMRMIYFFFAKAIYLVKQFVYTKRQSIRKYRQISNLNPSEIPKYVNQLPKPLVYKPFVLKVKTKVGFDSQSDIRKEFKDEETRHLYFVDISEFKEQILPLGYPKTTVWGYGGLIKDPMTGWIKYSRSSPGATFEAQRGIPVMVKWINRLTGSHLFAVDPTLHWANPNDMPMDPLMPWPSFPPGFPDAQKPVPIVTHLHGGEVQSISDGHPDSWFTSNGIKGPEFATSLYTYPNTQEATTLWYHDHALGITRLNVYAGLAGFYLLRDRRQCDENFSHDEELSLPKGKYEIPIVIQDRSFNNDGSLSFTNEGVNPDIHPYWNPEFFGNTIMVNGKVWPNLEVGRRQYRFRLLNGSNARFYNLKLSNSMTFTQIASDGGLLPKPVVLNSLLIAPAERAEILIDFSNIDPGTSIIFQNTANAPYPDGDAPDPDTTGQIMQFSISEKICERLIPEPLPHKLNYITKLIPDAPTRILTLNEIQGPNGPEMILLNGQKWSAPISELPKVGSTEEWDIINLTMDTHPIHVHLVQFQALNRQKFDVDRYMTDWTVLNGMPPLNHPTIVLPIETYLDSNGIIEPDENEKGWKDTLRMNPGEVTRIIVRFAPQNISASQSKPGLNQFPFNPAIGPGYVWHCHIIDHEDNEMMRPYKVKF